MKFPETYRFQPATSRYHSNPGDPFGTFVVPAVKAPGRRTLYIIASDGELNDWDHVSVSLGSNSKTPPTWEEMCFVKDLFWEPDDCVVQFHPAEKDYVNCHPGTLHLWKQLKNPFPMPPKICV